MQPRNFTPDEPAFARASFTYAGKRYAQGVPFPAPGVKLQAHDLLGLWRAMLIEFGPVELSEKRIAAARKAQAERAEAERLADEAAEKTRAEAMSMMDAPKKKPAVKAKKKRRRKGAAPTG